MSFVLPPSVQKPAPDNKQGTFSRALHTQFSLSTLLLCGATLQVLLFLLPIRPVYTLGPAVFLLGARFAQTMLITYNILPNPYMVGAITHKVTAQVPDRDGNYPGPGQEKIAVLMLGAKSNHPLGIFAPQFKEMGDHLEVMHGELDSSLTQEPGCLGMTAFNRVDANGANEGITMSYWRSIDDVHRYAHGPTHTKAVAWFNAKVSGKNNSIGIMHELFEAPAGKWENIYQNFQPTMMGSTTYLRRDGKLVAGEVAPEWVNPLMECRGELRTSNGRRSLRD